jgi:tetratricopeptide (TPR) repeat protein
LAEACGDDAALRQRIEALLKSHEEAGSFLNRPLAERLAEQFAASGSPEESQVRTRAEENGAGAAMDEAFACRAGAVIGPYKLLQRIGEGGMGTVWMAEQTQPVQRMVALKLIKSGMDSRQVIARFEAERQALALMDHPNIARVLDAGTTEGGRPYFVMELVKGVPITKYCDEHHLTPTQRLELFMAVCAAVQHAHQKGIIHRDLKPSNVMVCAYDGRPVPKVIDFGVAKAAGPRLTDKTLFTEIGQIVGTLEYMSPEQAELNQLDVDTRSDIYALGVLLYELLTGSTPLERKRVQAAALLEALRLIREEEPPKPSTRLSTTEQLPAIAANRGLEPRKLSGLLRGELDWIVMKALEKERNRRYETPSALAQDIERFLNDEPVLACPPSAWYRLGKSARRHKMVLGTAALLLLMIAVTAATVGWTLSDRAEQKELQRTEDSRRLAETQRVVNVALGRAESLMGQARHMPGANSEEAAAVLAVWRQAADALAHAKAALNAGIDDGDLRQRVAHAQRQNEKDLRRAELTLAGTRRRERLFRDLDEARLARLTIIEQDFDHAGGVNRFATAFMAYGLDVDKLGVDELARRIKAEDPAVQEALLIALIEWANEAAVSTTRWNPAELRAIVNAADNDDWRRRYRAALAGKDPKALDILITEALDLPLTASNTILLATDLQRRGRRDDAVTLLRRGRTRHPADVWVHFTLGAWFCTGKGRTPSERQEGIGCFRAALALRPGAGVIHNNLGAALFEAGQLDEAMLEFKTTLALEPNLAMAHTNVAYVFHAKQRLKEAHAEYTQAINLDPKDARPHHGLGRIYHTWKKLDDAKAAYEKAVAIDAGNAESHLGLGNVLSEMKRFREAIVPFETASKLDTTDARPRVILGNAHWRLKNLAQAKIEYEKAIKIDAKLASPHFGLGVVHQERKELDAAMSEFKKAIELDSKHAPTHNRLGNVLLDKKKLDAALTEFEIAIKIDPKHAQSHNGRGMVLYEKKQWDAAKAEFETALKLDPGLARAHNNLGTYWHDRQQWDKALAAYKKAIELDPDDAMPRHGLGNVLRARRDLKGAMAEYKRSIEIDPRYAPPHDGLGDVYRDMNKLDEAKAAYENAIAIDPKFALPHIGVGIVHYFRKEFDKAISAYKKAIELDPTDADPHFNLGLVLNQTGQWQEAEAEFRKALAIDRTYFKAQNALGNLMVKMQRWEDAIVEFQRTRDLEPENPGHHFNLGNALRHEGKFAAALQAMKIADKLGRAKPGWTMPSSHRVKQYERLIELEKNESRALISMESAAKGIRSKLTKDDFFNSYPNAMQSFRKSYSMMLKGGQAYQIDLVGDFDVLLHVENRHYVTLAYNDDVTPPKNLDARLVFTPEKDDVYRLVVTSYKPGDTGRFNLTVNEVVNAGEGQTVSGELKKTDKAVEAIFYKIHKVDLVAGRPYVFDLDSSTFDSCLVLLDPTGKQKLTFNDEAGEFISASRINFTPQEAGTYRLVVTTYDRGAVGPYTLRIQGYERAAEKKP